MLSIPSWLATALSWLNWDILGVHIDVGTTLTSGINWILGGINDLTSYAHDVEQGVINTFAYAVNLFNSVESELHTDWNDATAWFGNIPNQLSDLRTSIWNDVLGAVADTKNWANTLITDVRSGLGSLEIMYNDFTTNILPNLVRITDLADFKNGIMLSLNDLITLYANFGQLITTFFSDPIQWIADRLEQIIERIW